MEKSLRDRFGEALQTLRRSKGKSQEALEVVHRTYLSELERGLKSPTLETIVRLAEALEVTPAYLVAMATAPDAKTPSSSAQVSSLDLAGIVSRALPAAIDPTKLTSQEAADLTASSTLAEVAAQAAASGVSLDRLLGEATLIAFRDRAGGSSRTIRNALRFLIADKRSPDQLLYTKNSRQQWSLDVNMVLKATVASNLAFELIHDLFIAYEFPLFDLLGLRNLSSFVGAVFGREIWRLMSDKTFLNPHQDGYPDLCAATKEGFTYRQERNKRGEMTAKSFWSPYPYGGIEVKATCGNTPAAKTAPKPKIGESRYPLLTSAEWKAHHRDTNNLLGIFWDFVDGLWTKKRWIFLTAKQQKQLLDKNKSLQGRDKDHAQVYPVELNPNSRSPQANSSYSEFLPLSIHDQ
jgi:transcriptional regulator with XRE-family HTH domain